MKPYYRLKVFCILFVFACVFVCSIAIMDYNTLKNQVIQDSEFQIERVEDTLLDSLNTVDKALYFFDQETASVMKTNTEQLLEHYKANPNLEEWDFKKLSNIFGMDIHILDKNNVIVYSTEKSELGLDFAACCKSFNKLLNERRATGEFYVDGIDLEQSTGEIKKYSYMATHDKEYIFELSFNLGNTAIFEEFNFLAVVSEIEDKYAIINEVNVIHYGGHVFGESDIKLLEENRDTFQRVLESEEVIEIDGKWNGEEATYRYVPYASEYDIGTTKNNVIEIVYHDNDLKVLLQGKFKLFFIQLIIIIIVVSFVSFIISRWFSKPIHMAYHDSLTGLKNRAAFDEFLEKTLKDDKGTTSLLMMDLDNFKLVNDYLGHDSGDYLLRLIAKRIDGAILNEYPTFRLGGDEFAIIMGNTDKNGAESTAIIIINTIKELMQEQQNFKMLNVSISIGIAVSKENDIEPRDLYKNADIALYASKEKGKNCYQTYTAAIKRSVPFII